MTNDHGIADSDALYVDNRKYSRFLLSISHDAAGCTFHGFSVMCYCFLNFLKLWYGWSQTLINAFVIHRFDYELPTVIQPIFILVCQNIDPWILKPGATLFAGVGE